MNYLGASMKRIEDPRLLVGGGLMGLVGVIDDTRGIRALYKFGAQLAAGGIAFGFGFKIDAVRIPGLYEDTNRRTNFQFNYSGNHSTSLQDSYLTVPDASMRVQRSSPSG